MTHRLRMVALEIALAVSAPAGEAKGRPPADVPRVVVGAIRYEVPRMGTPFGDVKDGSIQVARRADYRALLWTRRAT